MPAEISSVDKVRFDTMLAKAESGEYDRLASLYGVERLSVTPANNHRVGLLAAALGPRGTRGVTQRVLQAMLEHAATEFTVTVAAANPQRITHAAAGFTDDHVHRLIRIDGVHYWSVGPADVDAAGNTYLDLADTETSYWAAANWTATATKTAQVLAYVLWEPTPRIDEPTGATTPVGPPCTVEVRLAADVFASRPTYMQASGTTARPAGEPHGGHLQADEWGEGDVSDGPHPPYLTGDVGSVISDLIDPLLAASVKSRFRMPMT